MQIYLVRHGIAEDVGPDGGDASRRLTNEGRKKTAKVAEGFRERVKNLDSILHSPYARAVETAQIFGEEFSETPLREVTFLTPYDPPEKALALLRENEHLGAIMLVGHQPYMSACATLLLTGKTSPAILEFKRAGVAAIDWDPGTQRGQLLFHLSPKFF